MDLIQRSYRIGKKHDIVVKKAARKFNISESEVIRRRIPSWEDMLKELAEDLRHSDDIDLNRHSR